MYDVCAVATTHWMAAMHSHSFLLTQQVHVPLMMFRLLAVPVILDGLLVCNATSVMHSKSIHALQTQNVVRDCRALQITQLQ